jgi:hypothetical protein
VREEEANERIEVPLSRAGVRTDHVGVRQGRERGLPDAEHHEPGGREALGLPCIPRTGLQVVPVTVHLHGHPLRPKEAVHLDAGQPGPPHGMGEQTGQFRDHPDLQ